jgi:hypothetical protein
MHRLDVSDERKIHVEADTVHVYIYITSLLVRHMLDELRADVPGKSNRRKTNPS